MNLYTNATFAHTDVEIWQGYKRSGTCAKKLVTVPFGQVSDALEVFGSDEQGNWVVTAFVPGGSDDDHEIISQTETWKGGEELTMLITAQDPKSGNPPAFGSDQAFFDNPAKMATVTTAPGKATLAISASAIQFVAPDKAWRLGVPGKGCLPSVGDTDHSYEQVGGTSLLSYAVDAGSLEIALYPGDPGDCAGAPDIGPMTLNIANGSRTYIYAYGTDVASLKLLVLPLNP